MYLIRVTIYSKKWDWFFSEANNKMDKWWNGGTVITKDVRLVKSGNIQPAQSKVYEDVMSTNSIKQEDVLNVEFQNLTLL